MLKNFLQKSISYALIEGVQKGILFLITPLLTFYMTPSEYGIVSSSLMIISFLSITLSLSLPGAINRFYYRYSTKLQEVYLSSVFIFLIVILFVFSGFLFLFGPYISPFLFPEIKYYPYVIYIIGISVTQPLLTSLFTLLKIKQDLRMFAFFYNFYFLIQIILFLLLIVEFKMEANGYLLSMVISNLIFCTLSIFYLYRLIGLHFDSRFVVLSLKYSLPIIPVDLLRLINALIDRYYILLFLGLASVGVYYIGVQLSALITLVTLAINSAYVPIFFKMVQSKDSNYKKLYVLSDLIVAFSCCMSVFVSVFGPYFIELFYEERYWAISEILPLLIFNAGLTSIYFFNTNVLSLNAKLVRLKTYIIFSGVIINLILSWYLTRIYGLYGAALSTLISSIIIILVYMIAVRVFTSFRFNNYLHLCLMIFGFVFVMLLNHNHVFLSDFSLYFKIVMCLIFYILITLKCYRLYVE